MSDRIRFNTCVCGIGRIAYLLEYDALRNKPATHIGAIKQNPYLELTDICDTNEYRLERFFVNENMYDISYYSDYKKMTIESDCEIAVISTDSYTHIDIIEFFIENMKNLKSIVCEKPLALDYASALSIKDILVDKNLFFYVNHTRRWNINYMKTKHIIKSQKLGKLKQVVGFINAGGQKFMGEGPILHDGTHLIDNVLFFTEYMPDALFADVVMKDNVEKCVNVYYKTSDDVDVYMNLSSDKKYFFYELELYFESGRIIIGNQRFEIYYADRSSSFTGFIELKKVEDLDMFEFPEYKNRNFFEILYNEICDDRKNNIVNNESYFETLKVQKIIDMIFENIEKNQ